MSDVVLWCFRHKQEVRKGKRACEYRLIWNLDVKSEVIGECDMRDAVVVPVGDGDLYQCPTCAGSRVQVIEESDFDSTLVEVPCWTCKGMIPDNRLQVMSETQECACGRSAILQERYDANLCQAHFDEALMWSRVSAELSECRCEGTGWVKITIPLRFRPEYGGMRFGWAGCDVEEHRANADEEPPEEDNDE